jgi:hypothetical protein
MDKTKHEVTLTKHVWLGVLIHLKDTVELIPVTAIDPDPWDSVNKLIAQIEKFVTLDDY